MAQISGVGLSKRLSENIHKGKKLEIKLRAFRFGTLQTTGLKYPMVVNFLVGHHRFPVSHAQTATRRPTSLSDRGNNAFISLLGNLNHANVIPSRCEDYLRNLLFQDIFSILSYKCKSKFLQAILCEPCDESSKYGFISKNRPPTRQGHSSNRIRDVFDIGVAVRPAPHNHSLCPRKSPDVFCSCHNFVN